MSAVTLSSRKAEIFAAYTAACAEVQAQRHTIRDMRDRLAMSAQPALSFSDEQALRLRYYAYLKVSRAAQPSKVKTIKSFSDWSRGITQ